MSGRAGDARFGRGDPAPTRCPAVRYVHPLSSEIAEGAGREANKPMSTRALKRPLQTQALSVTSAPSVVHEPSSPLTTAPGSTSATRPTRSAVGCHLSRPMQRK